MTPAQEMALVAKASELVGIVRDYGSDTIGDWLGRLDRQALIALTVTLAAMVPDDKSPGQLLAWLDADAAARNRRTRAREERRKRAILRDGAHVTPAPVQPCGTHAAFNRHKKAGEPPCELCMAGERIYQRERKRSKRAAA